MRTRTTALRTPSSGCAARGCAAASNATSSTTPILIRVKLIRAWFEPARRGRAVESRLQFERHGYFCVADRIDSQPGKLVPTVPLRQGIRGPWSGKDACPGSNRGKPSRDWLPCL